MLNHDLLFSVRFCLLLDVLVKETTSNVMVDDLQSRGAPWRQCTSQVKVRGTLSKMDVRASTIIAGSYCGIQEFWGAS